jgi:hypothetical protein
MMLEGLLPPGKRPVAKRSKGRRSGFATVRLARSGRRDPFGHAGLPDASPFRLGHRVRESPGGAGGLGFGGRTNTALREICSRFAIYLTTELLQRPVLDAVAQTSFMRND